MSFNTKITITFLAIVSIIVFFYSLKKKENQIKSTKTETKINGDTIFSEFICTNENYSFESQVFDTSFNWNEQKVNLKMSAKLLENDTLKNTDTLLENSKININKYVGFDASYDIQLLDEKGNLIFKTNFDKNTFKNECSFSDLVTTAAFLPEFVDYLPSFDAFLFKINIGEPQTDYFGENIFLINSKGEIIDKRFSKMYGAEECAGNLTVSTNKDYFMTCYEIVKPNKNVIKLYEDNVSQIGVEMINDNCILVIQEAEKLKNLNAKFVDNNGNTLKKFTFNGYYSTLDYALLIDYEELTKMYYMLDIQNHKLISFSKEKPLEMKSMNYMEFPPHNNTLSTTENVVEFDALDSTYRFYIYPEKYIIKKEILKK